MASVRFGVDDYAPPDVFASDNQDAGRVTSPGKPVATQPASYPTSPSWLDTAHPPQPQDPYYAEWQRTNPTNPAAQAPAIGPQLGMSSSGSVADLVNGWMKTNNPWGHQDAQYWIDKINGGGGIANAAYWQGRFLENPNNNPHTGEVFGGQPTNAPGAYHGPNPGGYDDPSSMLFLNEVMDRLNSLKSQQNQSDPFQALLQLFSLNRVNDLGKAPYTAGEDAALRAHYLDPLTQARDQGLQMNRERISARGMLPSSGMLDVLDRGTQQGYERAVGQGANDTALAAINEKQRRQDEQLSILSSLLGVSRTSQDRNNAIGREIVSTAETFPNFDNQRLSQLLQASGEGASSPSSILSGVTGLGGLGVTASNNAYNHSADSAAAWGQILGYLLSHANG